MTAYIYDKDGERGLLEKYKYILICGHYGCGKTNLALNLAADFSSKGMRVTLVDLDIVNPYFRSSDFKSAIDKMNVRLIAPAFAHSNVDLPSLPTEMYSIFDDNSDKVIIDVGGDDQGAVALGRFSNKIKATENYCMVYVVNKFRPLSATGKDALEILSEIEAASRIKADAIINNSHLMAETTAEDIISSVDYARQISDALSIPVIATTVPKALYNETANSVDNLYAIDIYVKPPWADN